MLTAKHLLDNPVVRTIRFDSELLEKIKESADKSLRSVTAEINFRLHNSFKRDEAETVA
jgi:hypothetical protein